MPTERRYYPRVMNQGGNQLVGVEHVYLGQKKVNLATVDMIKVCQTIKEKTKKFPLSILTAPIGDFVT